MYICLRVINRKFARAPACYIKVVLKENSLTQVYGMDLES